ncbi:TRAP transporter small permease [Desulfobacula sp.]|uniref:TRAP transporter small permease n=1 Tax=Desulfobacula sp. TaxID=2593537 RepID=UPI0026339B55|nr:TRAP transporter small permease [Desulfobacula sp.]
MSSSQNFFFKCKKGTERLVNLSLAVGMGWVMVMMLLTTFDVAGRYFLSKPIPGAIEMSEFTLAIFGMLGMAYTHKAGANIKVTMLTDALPPAMERLLEVITSLLSFQIVAMLAWYGVISGIEEFHAGTTTDTLGIPLYPLYFLLCIGAGLLCLEMLMNIIETIQGFFGTQVVEPDQAS